MLLETPRKCLVSLAVGAALSAACGSSKTTSRFNDPNGSTDGGLFTGNGSDGGLGPSGSSVLGAGCATATADTTRSPVYMLIVLDGSGSMADDHKWDAVVPALSAIFDDFLAKNDNSAGVGLVGFSDSNDPSCMTVQTPFGPVKGGCAGPYPTSGDVRVAAVDQAHHDKLIARLAGAIPQGDTPTLAALKGSFTYLEGFAPATPLPAGGKKVLVLMTDGVPTDSNTTQDSSLVAGELLKTPPFGPITTFGVGVGPFPSPDLTGYDPTFLGQLAKAGGAAPSGCNPIETQDVSKACYFQITPGGKSVQQLTQDFVDAINKIRRQVATCEFLLQKGNGAVDPTQVNVIYTDQSGAQHVLVQDDSNGWTYDDPTNPTKVILHGTDCSDVQNDPNGSVSIILGCATVTK